MSTTKINIGDTYLGFTDNMKPLQRGRAEKLLDGSVRVNGEYLLNKEFIFDYLKLCYVPDIEEDYTYYSSKTGSYTKPRTLYSIRKDGNYFEINKTLYDFANYLIDNNFLDDNKMANFIEVEKEKVKEAERIKREEEEKQKLEREREKEESKKRRKQKIKEWAEIGRKLMSDEVKNIITESIEIHWDTVIKAYPDTDKNEFLENSISHSIPQSIGNFEYMKNRMQYLVHECENWNSLNNIIEKDMYMKIYRIDENDSKRTITAKIKAFMDGREYKGGTSKSRKIEIFYARNRDGSVEKKKGELYSYKDIKCFITKDEQEKYKATEESTGMSLTSGHTNKELLKRTIRDLIDKKQDTINKAIESAVNKYGDLKEYNSES